MRLIDAIAESSQVSGRNTTLVMRLAPCMSFTATTVTVNVDGTLVAAARAKGYSPVVGDQVIVVLQAGAWLAIGAVPMLGVGPRNIENHQTLGANAGVGTSEGTVLSVAWDFLPGDVIKVEMNGLGNSNGDNRQLTVNLRENGVALATRVFTFTTIAAWPSYPFYASRIRRGLVAGTYTYTVTAIMNAFTGNLLAGFELSVVLLGAGQ